MSRSGVRFSSRAPPNVQVTAFLLIAAHLLRRVRRLHYDTIYDNPVAVWTRFMLDVVAPVAG